MRRNGCDATGTTQHKHWLFCWFVSFLEFCLVLSFGLDTHTYTQVLYLLFTLGFNPATFVLRGTVAFHQTVFSADEPRTLEASVFNHTLITN